MIPLSQHITDRLNLLEDILASLRVNNITLSKSEAIKIVGSRGLLEKLVATGKIRMKRRQAQFGRWDCIAEDVLKYVNYKERLKYNTSNRCIA